MKIRADLAYTNATGSVLCTDEISNVALSKGVFHVKIDFDCSLSGKTLTQVLSQTPAGHSVAIQITDITDGRPPKSYSFQALHAMPYATVASQLAQLGANDGEFLKWNDTDKKWEAGNVSGASGGTVTNVTATSPLSVTSGATTPALAISQANGTTSGYLSSADWTTFNSKEGTITGGTATQYYRGDKTWTTLDTSVVPENGNLYFTNSRVLGLPLTGFSATNSAIVATDTVVQGFSKAQGQINAINSAAGNFLVKNGTDSITGTVNVSTGFLTITNPPSILTDVTNKQYVDTGVNAKVSKAGDTMSGVLTLDDDLKIKGGSNYVTVKGHASSGVYNLVLPSSAGSSGQFLQTDGSGNTSWVAQSSTATPSGVAGGGLTGTYPNPAIANGLDAAKLSAGNVSNTEFDYLDGVSSAIQTQLNNKQATNANLSSLSSYNTNGILVQTAANTFAGRSVLGTANRVSVTNGSGVGGDPTIDIASGLLPSPTAGDNGKFLKASGANASAWSNLSASDITGALTYTPVNKAGDTVSGVLTLDNDLKVKGGSNYVTVKGHATSGAYNLILPSSAGTTGQVLQTDGSGNLSWSTPSSSATPTGAAGGGLAGTYPNPTIASGLDAVKLSAGNVSNTEFDYLNGVTSSIQTQLNGKEGTLTAGTATQFYRGDKTWQTLDTLAVPENTNQYFTKPRVLATDLAGFSANNSTILATDSVLAGFNKAQGQITNLNTIKANVAGDTFTGDVNFNTQINLKNGGAANYVTIKTNTAGTTAYTLSLPLNAGTANQVLTTNGSGVTSWTSPATALPPNGAAGGDLAGTYPNPTVKSGLDAAKLSAGSVTNTEFDYLDGVTSSIQSQLNNKQPIDPTLTSLAAYNTNGILVQTGVDTFVGRSIVGTSNRINISNGSGVAGDPTINIDTGLLPSPTGSGQWLKSTGANTSAWTTLGSSDITGALGFTPINKAGDTISTGTIGFSAIGTLSLAYTPTNATDATSKSYVDNTVATAQNQWTYSGGHVYRSNGNVGIGTTNPTEKLHVENSSGVANILIKGTATSGSTRAEIKLDRTDNPRGAGMRILDSATGGAQWWAGVPYNGGGATDFFTIGRHATQPEYIANSFLTINSIGNVGIGTTAPSSILHVAAAGNPVIKMQDTANLNSTNAFAGWISGQDSSGVESWWVGEGSNSGKSVGLVASSAGYEVKVANTAGSILINSAGNVGIGTAAPTAKLEVAGTAKVTGDLFGAVKDTSGNALKSCAGRSGLTWTYYSINSAATGACGAYIDINTSACGFSTVFKYFPSLGGSGGHWTTTGANSVYNSSATGFRIYINVLGGYDATTCNATTLPHHGASYYIDWLAVGM